VIFWILGAMFVGALFNAQWQAKRRKASWREVAQALGGTCIENTWTSQVLIPIKSWSLTLDTFTSTSKSNTPGNTIYTRLRIPLTGLQDFGFALMRRNSMSQLLIETIQSPLGRLATVGNVKAQQNLQLLNCPEVRLADQSFNHAFTLKSEQERQARQLFEQVKNQVCALQDFQIFLIPYEDVTSSTDTQTLILHYQEKGLVADVAHLKEVCRTLEKIVQELHRAGMISDQKPPIASPLAL
jgi:hypothetical protein